MEGKESGTKSIIIFSYLHFFSNVPF